MEITQNINKRCASVVILGAFKNWVKNDQNRLDGFAGFSLAALFKHRFLIGASSFYLPGNQESKTLIGPKFKAQYL